MLLIDLQTYTKPCTYRHSPDMLLIDLQTKSKEVLRSVKER